MMRWTSAVVALAAASCAAFVLPAVALGADCSEQGARDAATYYLSTRAAAIVSRQSRGDLMKLFAPGSPQARVEALLAVGANKSHQGTKSVPSKTTCSVDITSVKVSDQSATVVAHAEVITYFTANSLRKDYQGDGLTHTISLVFSDDRWLVTDDDYASDTAVTYLRDAGAPAPLVAEAKRDMISAFSGAAAEQPGSVAGERKIGGDSRSTALADPSRGGPRRGTYTVHLSRAEVQAYADRHWSSYNPRYVKFAADCANFVSQCIHCDEYPDDSSSAAGFWYYNGSYPWSYSNAAGYPYSSEAWRFCPTMVSSWKTRAAGVPNLGTKFIQTWTTTCPGNWGTDWRRGDCIWWDFSDESPWYPDHVAVVVDFVNGKSLVDAHTADHYHIAAGDIGTVGRRYGHLYDDILYAYG